MIDKKVFDFQSQNVKDRIYERFLHENLDDLKTVYDSEDRDIAFSEFCFKVFERFIESGELPTQDD